MDEVDARVMASVKLTTTTMVTRKKYNIFGICDDKNYSCNWYQERNHLHREMVLRQRQRICIGFGQRMEGGHLGTSNRKVIIASKENLGHPKYEKLYLAEIQSWGHCK